MDLDNVTFVLHRPSAAENIGAVARVLANFGLPRLALVAPPAWEGPARTGQGATGREDVLLRARRTARHAGRLLDSAAVHGDLRGALAGCTWACGTSSRAVAGRPVLSPRQLAAELGRRSRAGPVAVVFGEERRGLSDAELDHCQAVCAIPTSAAYDSMNLAQAVAVLAYEIATAGGAPVTPSTCSRAVEPARHATMETLWARLGEVFAAVGYSNPQNPEHILAEWRLLLARAEPTQREVELLVTAVKAVARKLRLEGP